VAGRLPGPVVPCGRCRRGDRPEARNRHPQPHPFVLAGDRPDAPVEVPGPPVPAHPLFMLIVQCVREHRVQGNRVRSPTPGNLPYHGDGMTFPLAVPIPNSSGRPRIRLPGAVCSATAQSNARDAERQAGRHPAIRAGFPGLVNAMDMDRSPS